MRGMGIVKSSKGSGSSVVETSRMQENPSGDSAGLRSVGSLPFNPLITSGHGRRDRREGILGVERGAWLQSQEGVSLLGLQHATQCHYSIKIYNRLFTGDHCKIWV